jgi:glycosyltransferase involved in cell wall biosynthesis
MKPLISVITCTYNAENDLTQTAESIRKQKYKNFEWIVIDGASKDSTIDIVINNKNDISYYISEPDNGIYDALNKGIQASNGEYYLVIGAGDTLNSDSLLNFSNLALTTNSDILCAAVLNKSKILNPNRGGLWRHGAGGIISHHSVGTAIRKSLHQEIGFYSINMKALSDNLFLQKALNYGAKISFSNFISGEYKGDGISEKNRKHLLKEFYEVQIQSGHNKNIQSIIYFIRKLISK